jgi:hypothetical protein
LHDPAAPAEDFPAYCRTQQALARSRMVLNASLRNPAVAQLAIIRAHSDPVLWLEENLRTEFDPATALMKISLSGDDPEYLILINAIREAYLSEVVEKENNDRHTRLEKLKSAYQELDEHLRDKRHNMRALAEVIGGAAAGDASSGLAEELRDCKRELRRVRLVRVALRDPESKEKAALDAQEKWLMAEEGRLTQELQRRGVEARRDTKDNLDLNSQRAEVEEMEQLARRLLAEIERGKLEAQAPSRVLGHEEAAVGRGG